MNRSKREDYKRFVVFCLASLIVIAQAAIFAYVWYDFYSDLILKPFWRKGNWVMILIYALIYLMFAKLYGGLKVGYLKRIDVFYSLTLATICTNVVTYFQITLINRWFMSARPVIEMTGVQLVVTVLWIWGSRYIYSRLYGARRLLVIYGDRDPGDVIHKMNTRKDKYDISGKVHIREGEEKIHAMMEDYEGVIIWDLPSQIRNKYLKYCFSHSIRCYMSPKISDIILLGTDRIHLFDTPLLMCRNQGLSMEQRAAKRVLDIIVSGKYPPNPSELLASDRMAELLEECKKHYDYIIIDGTPLCIVSDALVLSPHIDGYILVAMAETSSKRMIKNAVSMVRKINGKVLGFVLTKKRVSGREKNLYGGYNTYYNTGY